MESATLSGMAEQNCPAKVEHFRRNIYWRNNLAEKYFWQNILAEQLCSAMVDSVTDSIYSWTSRTVKK